MKMYIVKESEYRPLKGKKIGIEAVGCHKNPNRKPTTRDLLFEFMKETREQFQKINSRLDKQGKEIKFLRIDVQGINTRIDHLVKKNNLIE